MHKRYNSRAIESKELKSIFILYAYDVTDNEMGIVRFSKFLNKFISNYKENAEDLYNKYKETDNNKLTYVTKLCDFIKKNPTVVNYNFSVYTVQKVLRNNGKFYATSNRTKPLNAKRETPTEKTKKKIANNILNRKFRPEFANYAWGTDITEYEYKRGCKAYICAVRDLYCGSVIGFHVSNNMRTNLVITALNNAITNTGAKPLLLHSDGGKQFCSHEYMNLCQSHGIERSISRPGKCHDNAKMESFFANLKTEIGKESNKSGYSKLNHYSSLESFIKHVTDYIDYYNYDRVVATSKNTRLENRELNLNIFSSDPLFNSISYHELQAAYLESLKRNISTTKVILEIYSFKLPSDSN